ncbi:hypothetical protein OF117_03055 [Geodermatophilus sp. YIM 151500]|uniref:hypothetical protein n=1 Tax=Geodermatophilus sp. YIM 151500 TaxID=2984531 RepID=UPI0021E50384|nr:hypothetical protein [Geodermatophilus sp. YIM 151500]MCV2488329.1 hypothetical protein [Geodermatophilus sp. YIM 151500]
MDEAPRSAAAGAAVPDPVADAIDGSTGDWSVSGDAMRWSPELAERGPGTVLPGPLAGLDVAAGLGSVLGLDGAGVRRLVSGALSSLTVAAGDVAGELRELVRPREPRDGEGQAAVPED